jgi:hypothetical protein
MATMIRDRARPGEASMVSTPDLRMLRLRGFVRSMGYAPADLPIRVVGKSTLRYQSHAAHRCRAAPSLTIDVKGSYLRQRQETGRTVKH